MHDRCFSFDIWFYCLFTWFDCPYAQVHATVLGGAMAPLVPLFLRLWCVSRSELHVKIAGTKIICTSCDFLPRFQTLYFLSSKQECDHRFVL